MLERTIQRIKSAFRKDDWDQSEFQGLLSNEQLEDAAILLNGQQDTHHIVYWVFFIYGLAMLLPWNVFITASEYFARRFTESPFEETFQNYFSRYYTMTSLLAFACMLWKQNKTPLFQVDVFLPVTVNTIVFAVMAATVVTSVYGELYFWISMGLLVLTGVTTSIFQISVFAEASQFPPEYIQAVMSGQGVAGVAVAVASILSAFAGSANGTPNEEDISRSAFIYFLAALALTILAMVGRIVVSRQAFYVRQLAYSAHIPVSDQEDNAADTLPLNNAIQDNASVWSVITKSAGLIFAVGYIFVVTLALFPSITALIKSVVTHNPQHPEPSLTTSDNSRFFDDDVFVAFHFLLFNVGDWIGRTLPVSPFFRTFKAKTLVLLSILRTVFVPAFLFCNVVVSNRRLPVLIDSDAAYFVIVLLFAISNGWLGSLSMMAAPQQPSIRTAKEKSLVGSVMTFSLLIGLAVGGSLSFLIRSMV